MNDDDAFAEALESFDDYWDDRVRKGEVSRFDRLEWNCIEIFAHWMHDHYELTPKSEVPK